MQFTIGESIVEIDVKETKASYEKICIPGPEECGCTYCRNWIAQRAHFYTDKITEFLEAMGIKPGFETEVWEAPRDDGHHFYSGWYPFIGRFIKQGKGLEKIDKMEFWVSQGLSFVVPWLNSEQAQEIHFSAITPWILQEPPGPKPDAPASS